MSFFSNNISVILKRYPELNLTDPDTNLKFIKSRKGNVTAVKNGIFIHSKFNPVKEAENIITRECRDNLSVCIFYGFGLGYHIEAYLNQFPESNLIVLIPDLPFFLRALESRDMTGFLSSPNLYFFIKNSFSGYKKLFLTCTGIIILRTTTLHRFRNPCA